VTDCAANPSDESAGAADAAPDLSIIIVNWNSREFLRTCIQSVIEAESGLTFEIIVVDNASFDGSGAMVKQEFPGVAFIQSDKNLGFARANNLAYARSAGRNLLFLNPDTEVIGTALQTLLTFVDGRGDVGIAGPKLLNSDRTVQMESIRAFPTLANQFLDSHFLKSRFSRLSIWGMQPLFSRSRTPASVDVVSGACLMIKRQVFDRVGGFSTSYFMYSEDVDLCYKVREAGWASYFVGEAEVIHHGGKSSALTPVSQFSAVLSRESRFQFLRRTRGSLYAITFRAMTTTNALCRLGLLACAFPILGIRRASGTVAASRKWLSILRWSVGLERWVKALDK
jgi:GT2 family glycosyltransferase